jgi:hypothetical protein
MPPTVPAVRPMVSGLDDFGNKISGINGNGATCAVVAFAKWPGCPSRLAPRPRWLGSSFAPKRSATTKSLITDDRMPSRGSATGGRDGGAQWCLGGHSGRPLEE